MPTDVGRRVGSASEARHVLVNAGDGFGPGLVDRRLDACGNGRVRWGVGEQAAGAAGESD